MKKPKYCKKEFGLDKRMKLQMLILTSLTLVDCQLSPEYSVGKLTTDSEFLCPPERDIKPCRCSTIFEIPTVQCKGIRSLKAVHTALRDNFEVKPIPYLKIVSAGFVGLPSKAFKKVNMTRLLIADTHLKYVADDAFHGLRNLLVLVLQDVKLLTFPAQSLSHLSSLVTLSLRNNNIISLAYNDLRNTRGLKYLSLVDNRLLFLSRKAFPISIITLKLSNNHLITLNGAIKELFNLEWLFLNNNLLIDIEGEFEGLRMLRHLKLGKNNLQTLGKAFRYLYNLQVLELQYNNIKELGGSLKNLSQLKTLNLSMNLLYQLHYSDFEGLTSLQCLYLSHNRLIASNGALGNLPRLLSLDLACNKFQKFSLNEISSLPQLKILDLSENRLNYIFSESPFTKVHSVRVLLSKNNLTTLSDFMRYLPYLEDIDVSYNKLYFLKQTDFSASDRIDYINVEGKLLLFSIITVKHILLLFFLRKMCLHITVFCTNFK